MAQHFYDLNGQLITQPMANDQITLGLYLPDGEPAPPEIRLTRAQRSALFYFLNPLAHKPSRGEKDVTFNVPAIEVTPPSTVSTTSSTPVVTMPTPVVPGFTPVVPGFTPVVTPSASEQASEWVDFWGRVATGDKDGYHACCTRAQDGFFNKPTLSWSDPAVREWAHSAVRAGIIEPGIFPQDDARLGSAQRDLLRTGYVTGGDFDAAALVLSPSRLAPQQVPPSSHLPPAPPANAPAGGAVHVLEHA